NSKLSVSLRRAVAQIHRRRRQICQGSRALRDLRQPLDVLQYENAAVDFDQPRFAPFLQKPVDRLAGHIEMIGKFLLRQRDSEAAPGRTFESEMPVKKDEPLGKASRQAQERCV